jgi:hypothetical protein
MAQVRKEREGNQEKGAAYAKVQRKTGRRELEVGKGEVGRGLCISLFHECLHPW